MNWRVVIHVILMFAMTACILVRREHKSEGKFANAFARSIRAVARHSDAYIDKVINTTNKAVQGSDVKKLKALFSGQDSSTAIKAYRDFVDDKFQTTISTGKVLDLLLDQRGAIRSNKFTTEENRMILGVAKFVDEASTALNVHIDLMRAKHADLNKLIKVDFKPRELEKVAQQWRNTGNINLRLNARKLDYVSYQVRVIESLQSGKNWGIGLNYQQRLPNSLTYEQRQLIDKGKIWNREGLHDAILKRLRSISDMNDLSKTLLSIDLQGVKNKEAILRKEIELLLDIDAKFLQQLN